MVVACEKNTTNFWKVSYQARDGDTRLCLNMTAKSKSHVFGSRHKKLVSQFVGWSTLQTVSSVTSNDKLNTVSSHPKLQSAKPGYGRLTCIAPKVDYKWYG